MGIDSNIKRLFPAILCGLIAMAAYFQASGISQLMGAAVASSDEPPPPVAFAGPVMAPGTSPKTGRAILARNPFDSITGPLDGTTQSLPSGPVADEAPVDDGTISDADPACGFGRVVLISASDDPDWSFASITDGSGESKLRRIGDPVGSHTIRAMAWNRVWLADSSKRCQMRLGDKNTTAPKKMSGTVKKRGKKKKRPSRALAPELAAKISKVGDGEYNVERSLIDELLQNQAQLMRSARIRPDKEGGGIKLFGISKGSLLNLVGMENGDSLESINGFNMGDPQKALEAYGRLRTASELTISFSRGGKKQSSKFNIQ
jgi:general secretion pathway protein C